MLQRSVWQPLVDLRVIRRHHALVALFVGGPELHDELRVALKAVPDLDRLGARPTRAQAKLPGPADPRTPAAVTLPGLLAKLEGAVAAGEGESDGGGGGEGGGAAALLRNAPGDVLRGAGPPAPPGTVGAVVDMAHYSDGAVGTLDVLPGSAHAAAFAPAPYCRPGVVAPGDEGGGASLSKQPRLLLTAARHPCVELQDARTSIPNDYAMQCGALHFQIIMGPDMGGKPTYTRTPGTTCAMAQVGSPVPAGAATLSVLNSVLERVGAGDSAQRGVSTSMTEMLEGLGHPADRHGAQPRARGRAGTAMRAGAAVQAGSALEMLRGAVPAME